MKTHQANSGAPCLASRFHVLELLSLPFLHTNQLLHKLDFTVRTVSIGDCLSFLREEQSAVALELMCLLVLALLFAQVNCIN